MKKILSLLVAATMVVGGLSACGSKNAGGENPSGNVENTQTASDGEGPKIVTTIFPEYDWVMNVLGENPAKAEVTMLLNNGVDLHSYQPTADDIMKIATCDMFVYVGGESDGWVEDALKEATNGDMEVVNLLEVLGSSVKEEEMVEGMQAGEHAHDHGHERDDAEHEHDDAEHEHDDAEHEHDDAEHEHDDAEHEHDDAEHEHDDAEHEHDDAEHEHDDAGHEHDDAEHEHDDAGHGHEHADGEVEYDEHVWLSLKNASTLTSHIAEKLGKVDAANAETYKANAAAYVGKLEALDKQYQELVSNAPVKTLLFGDRFPFRYMVDDYGLSYYAAFVGCSAETEASFETITFLAGKVDELSLHAVMTIEGKEHKIAETIVQNTKGKDQAILTLDSMQSTTAEDVANGTTYLSIMEKNLSVLGEALK